MSLSNRTFVCFQCRTTERVPYGRWARNCRQCRAQAEYVYYKFRIPKKGDHDGWNELRTRVREVNAQIKTRALRSEQHREAYYQRLLATIADVHCRRELEAKLQSVREAIAVWESW